MILHVICTAYNRVIPLRGLIDSFMIQTDSRWKLYIVYDGPAPEKVKQVLTLYKGDVRVNLIETPKRLGKWGHPNRKMMLQKIKGAYDDYVLITNDDNYYMPVFVEYFLRECRMLVGLVYCNTIHNCKGYEILYTRLKTNFIDMGSFIVRLDIARAVGFNHYHLAADGTYAEECAAYCNGHRLKIMYIDKPLFVHN